MTQPVREFLDSFDRLAEEDRREAAFEILRRTRDFEYPPLDDEDLAQIADEIFQIHDAEEAADRPG